METPLDIQGYDPWMIKPTPAGNRAYIRSFWTTNSKESEGSLTKRLEEVQVRVEIQHDKGHGPGSIGPNFLDALERIQKAVSPQVSTEQSWNIHCSDLLFKYRILNVSIKAPPCTTQESAHIWPKGGSASQTSISLQHSWQISFGLLLEALHEVQYITCMCINRWETHDKQIAAIECNEIKEKNTNNKQHNNTSIH